MTYERKVWISDEQVDIDKLEWEEYRKKPLVIKAVKMEKDFSVDTMEGRMQGKAGDYLICGINGEFYPHDGDIFSKAYDEVKTSFKVEASGGIKEK